jgi:hypothetical protein
MDTQQPLALERRQPCLFQGSKGLNNRLPFWEDHKGLSLEQLTFDLPREFPKQAFHSIPADGSSESLPHHNTDPAASYIGRANHHVKEGGRDTTPVLLGILDVAAAFQE